MVAITEISAGLSGLKAAKEILQALQGIKSATELNAVKIDLQGHILEAQQGLFAAQQLEAESARRIAELESEIVGLKEWAAERERYELKRYHPGALAYSLKPQMAQGEPPHRLCTHCFHAGKKSILHAGGVERGYRVHRCIPCKSELLMGSEMTDEQPTPPPPPPPSVDHGESSWISARRGR